MPEKEILSWYIVRISCRSEKKVAGILDVANIEYHIPFRSVQRSWGELKKTLEIPMFQGLGFIKVGDFDLEMIKMMRETSLLMNRNNNFLTLSDEQMDKIKETPSALWEDILKPL